MAITHVTDNLDASSAIVGEGSSATVRMDADPQVSLAVLTIYVDDTTEGAFSSISDENSNTWTLRVNHTNGNQNLRIYTCTNPTVNADNTITVSFTNVNTDYAIDVHTYNGVDTTTPYVKNGTGSGTTDVPTVSFTPTNSDSLLIFAFGANNNKIITSYGTGQVDRGQGTQAGAEKTSFGNSSEILTAGGANNQTATLSGGGGINWLAAVIEIAAQGATTQTKTYTIDSRLVDRNTKSYTIDTVLQDTKTKTYTIDTVLQETKTKTYTVDTRLVDRNTKTYTVDTAFQLLGTDGTIDFPEAAVWGTNADQIIETFATYVDTADADASWVRSPASTNVFQVSTISDYLIWRGANNTTSQNVYYDLGRTLSNTMFALRFKVTHAARSVSGTVAAESILMLCSNNTVTWSTGTADGVGLYLRQGTTTPDFTIDFKKFNAQNGSGTQVGVATSSYSQSTSYYIEIRRKGDVFTTTVFSNSGYSNVIARYQFTDAGITDLAYIRGYANDDTGGTYPNIQIYVDDIELVDGGHFVDKQMKYYTIDTVLEDAATTFTKTYTIDTILQATKTKTYIIDTVLKGTNTKSYTIDTILKDTFTKSYTIDARLVIPNSASFTIDAPIIEVGPCYLRDENGVLVETEDGQYIEIEGPCRVMYYTIDTVLSSSTNTQTKTYTIDTVLKSLNNTKSYTIDTILQSTQTGSYTIDTVLKATNTKTYTIDAVFQALNTKTYTIDTALQLTNTKTYTIDTVLQEQFTKTYTIDAALQLTNTKTYTIDTVLQEQFTKTYTIDTILQKTNTKTYTIDSVFKKTNTKTYTIDTRLTGANTTSYTIDTILQDTFTKTYTIDTRLVNRNTKTYTVDTVLQEQLTKTYTIDSVLQKTSTKTYTIDSALQDIKTKAYTIDTALQTTNSKSYTIDVVLSKTQTKTYTIDSILKVTQTKSYTIDVRLAGIGGVFYTIDTALQALNTKTYTIDTRLVNRDVKTYTIDTVLQSINTKSYTIDTVLQSINTKTFTIDTALQEIKTKTYTIDTALQSVNTKTYTIDTVLQGIQTGSYTIDTVLKDTYTKQYTIDVVFAAAVAYNIVLLDPVQILRQFSGTVQILRQTKDTVQILRQFKDAVQLQ